jgi:hypothetical protein
MTERWMYSNVVFPIDKSLDWIPWTSSGDWDHSIASANRNLPCPSELFLPLKLILFRLKRITDQIGNPFEFPLLTDIIAPSY